MQHSIITLDRAILILEGLWDQLESTAAMIRAREEQPGAARIARARVATYRMRLRKLIEIWERGAVRGSMPCAQQTFVDAMREVADVLDTMEEAPHENTKDLLHRCQYVVATALHEVRKSEAGIYAEPAERRSFATTVPASS